MTSINIQQQIFLAVAYKATNISAIARAMGITRQSLHRKINCNTLKKEELCKIAKVLGGKYVSYFSFPGGVLIGDIRNNRKKKRGS